MIILGHRQVYTCTTVLTFERIKGEERIAFDALLNQLSIEEDRGFIILFVVSQNWQRNALQDLKFVLYYS